MEQARCSLSASHQHYNTRMDQTGEEVDIAPQFGTVYPLDLSSLISSQLPNLGNPYSFVVTPQLDQSSDCTPSSYLLNTTAYIDPTIFSPNYHAIQSGEVPLPSHASKPQEQMNWHHTTRGDLPAGEVMQMIKEGPVFGFSSSINSTREPHTYVDPYILADTGTSTHGSNVAYDTFDALTTFDQDSQMTSIIDNEANSYDMHYNAESRQLPSHVIGDGSVVNTLIQETSLLMSCDEFLYSNPEHQPVNSQEVPASRSFSFDVATGSPAIGEQALPFCSLEPAEHTDFPHKSYTQDPVGLPYLPQMNPYTSMPSVFSGHYKMAAQSNQLEFHEGTRPPDHHAIEVSLPIHPRLSADAQYARSHKDTQNDIAFSALSTHQLAIKDVGHKASQVSTYLPEQRHGHKKNRLTKSSNNTGADLSKIYQYINPAIDRERRAIQKKTRKVHEKLDRACFICKMGHRKVLVIVLYFISSRC
jgi:hypothetical protein